MTRSFDSRHCVTASGSIVFDLERPFSHLQGLKNPFCVPTDELLQAKDDLLSEPGQSLSSLIEQVARQSDG